MKESLELFCEEKIFEDSNGEIKVFIKYYVIHPDLRIKIYLKPIDKTASEVLKFLAYDNTIKKFYD